MKKKKIIVTGLMIALATTGLANNALAAGTSTKTTDADVSFELNKTPPDITEPGTLDPIEPEDKDKYPPIEVDGVWLLYAPSFHFGLQELPNKNENYELPYMAFSTKTDPTKYEIPHFVQVADRSGQDAIKWSVTAEQSDRLKTLPAAGPVHSLQDTRIKIKHQTLLTDDKTENAATMIQGLTFIGSEATIPLTADIPGGIPMLSSLAAGGTLTTNGRYSSVVLAEDFDPATAKKTADGDLSKRTKNKSVVLSVPFTDSPQKQKYEAKILWTLTVGP